MATVFVGTYTERLPHVNGRGAGIYVYSLNEGMLRPERAFRGLPNPSFLTIDPIRHRLYAVSESLEYGGLRQGAVQPWAWDSDSNTLEALHHLGTRGGAPCYISVTDHLLLIANYVGGSVTAIHLAEDGDIGQIASYMQHTGSGPNSVRQKSPHPHAIVPDPTGKYCLVPDLGTDEVYIYHLNRENRSLVLAGEAIKIHAGAGPRHLTFHPSGMGYYVLNELDSSISFLSWENGHSEVLRTTDALPEGYTGPRSGADIHAHPSGRFLYASLREISGIACFQIAENSGELTDTAWFSTHGRTPRNFALDPRGEFLIAANQDSDTLVVFPINKKTGHLGDPTQIINIPSPVCIQIVDLE
ncbi:MAG: lactonase family protein [Bacteroidetes bacterium]|nr:lactonase family protein [Bacteroidota bacterium]MCY4205725.1 lactonase family protein [Bacteroidota bacterium]